MTVMSMFNNCRVFREDMPDKDIEDAAVDFTNMVSPPRISEDYSVIFHYRATQTPDSIFVLSCRLYRQVPLVKYLGRASSCAVRPGLVQQYLLGCYPFPSFTVSLSPIYLSSPSTCVTRGSWTLLLGYSMGYRMTRFVTCR